MTYLFCSQKNSELFLSPYFVAYSIHFADKFLFKPKSIPLSLGFLFSVIYVWNKQDKCSYHINSLGLFFMYKNSSDLVLTLLLISLTQVESFTMHLHVSLSILVQCKFNYKF